MVKCIVFLLASFAVAAPALADEVVVPVQIKSTTPDAVGQRLAYKLKEGIRRSTRLDLTDDEKLGVQISLVTLEGNSDTPGYYTVYSAVWSWNNPAQNLFPFYLNSAVGRCGSNRVQECAESLVADTDEQATQVIQLVKAALKAGGEK